MHKVFVYGTLKEGFPNFHINNGIRFEENFITNEKYLLYLVGKRFSPWLVLNQGEGHQVQGQVFTVDDVTLAQMDKLERIYDIDGYRRIKLTVISQKSGNKLTAFVYGKPKEQLINENIQLELAGYYFLDHELSYIE